MKERPQSINPYFGLQHYAARSFGTLARIKTGLVKWFFVVSKAMIFRYDYTDDKYRKGMDFLTSFLGYPKKRVKTSAFRLGNMPAEWIEPDNLEHDFVILYMHGGAYNHGSIRSHRNIVTRLALECRCRVLIFEYRLAPEFPFPAPVEDAVAAYSFLRLQGIAAEKIVFAGDSAGGGLCLATAMQLRDNHLPLPMAIVCFSPWGDLECSAPEAAAREKRDPLIDIKAIRIWGEKYAKGTLRHPLASPVYGSYQDFCPLLLQIGEDEVLYADTERISQRFAEKNIPCRVESYESMIHVFQMFGGFLPQADQSFENVATFIGEVQKTALKQTSNLNSTHTA